MAEMTYASRGVAGTALGIGIGALGLNALNGGLGNLFNMNGGCGDNHYVSQREAGLSARIADLETEVKLRDSNIYTDSKILDLYKYVDGKFACVEKELCDQRVYNATNIANFTCLSNQVAQLMALTKNVIPITSICPQPAVATTTA
jgi:hypothetical protein